jgi:hypothetical protein
MRCDELVREKLGGLPRGVRAVGQHEPGEPVDESHVLFLHGGEQLGK